MVQNNKYYTPEIEDLHKGYQCEYMQGNQFLPFIIRDVNTSILAAKTGILRTPYLIKEQIEGEGWIFQQKIPFLEHRSSFKKGNHMLILDTKNEIPRISFYTIDIAKEYNRFDFSMRDTIPENFHFTADIKSINELRQTFKLLQLQ